MVEALLAVIRARQDRIRDREETVQQRRDDIAILKGQKPRPQIAPSRLEQPAPRLPLAEGQKRPGSQKRPKNAQLTSTQEIPIPFPDRPAGSVSKGYEAYVVQELVIHAETTRYLRERIVTADGQSLLAPLPTGVRPGQHFGPNLISHILHQYHNNYVTQPLLQDELAQLGITISAGQINHILTENKAVFHQQKAELLTAGSARCHVWPISSGSVPRSPQPGEPRPCRPEQPGRHGGSQRKICASPCRVAVRAAPGGLRHPPLGY